MEKLNSEIITEETQESVEETYKSGSMQYMDSREVAQIVEKEHKNLLRDITRYCKELNQLRFEPIEFFMESTYKDSKGRMYKCYLVTRKGCEFIAHKLTGIKGTKFTATYLERLGGQEMTLREQKIEKCEETITTLEIAEMMGVEHWQILRKLEGQEKNGKHIKGYVEILNDNEIVVVNYFIKSSYTDSKGEQRPCYLVTKLGCDFLANKFTGEKGVIFTAKYVKRFHEMEDTIKGSELAQIGELTRQLEEVRNLVQDLRNEQRENQKILVNPFNPGKSIVEGRLRNLNIKVSEVSSRYGLDRKKTLHYLYQTIEQDLGVSIDEYLQVYRDENKDDTISTLQVVSANTKFYNKALELIKNAIERKKVFG